MTPDPHWILDHVGHAVRDLDAALATYEQVFSLTPCVRESVPEHGVEIAFIDLPNSSIELLAPIGGNTKLAKFLDSKGEGLHHICYRVPSVEAELSRLRQLGIVLVDSVPRSGSRGMQIAFLHPGSVNGVLVELCSDS